MLRLLWLGKKYIKCQTLDLIHKRGKTLSVQQTSELWNGSLAEIIRNMTLQCLRSIQIVGCKLQCHKIQAEGPSCVVSYSSPLQLSKYLKLAITNPLLWKHLSFLRAEQQHIIPLNTLWSFVLQPTTPLPSNISTLTQPVHFKHSNKQRCINPL